MNIVDLSPALIVAIPLTGAFFTPLVSRLGNKSRNIFVILVLTLNACLVFLLASDIWANGIKTYIFGAKDLTYPIVRILFEVDAMSILMAIIASILLLAAVIFSWAFMREDTGLDKYYTLILLLTAGMLGMVFTGDMFNFFVFLEITSIASCALIAFWTHKPESLEAGFKYIIISAIGALFVLFSVALLYGQYDALNIAKLSTLIDYDFLDKTALVLLIAALGMKAGIVPMHMWLPDSYGRAPSPISIILVSATLACLYGMVRVIFTLYGGVLSSISNFDIPVNVFIGWFIVALAVISIIVGVIMALIQSDFKRLIAYGAVAELGYMFLGIGTGLTALGTTYGKVALQGGIFHIINDALDVGLLFLVAGSVYYATRETSLDRMGGLARNMKYTTIFFFIGLLAIAGMPPMNGFASKILIYESTFQLNPILAIVAILCSILLLAIFVKVFHSAFMGSEIPRFKEVKEVPKSMLIPMGALACLIIIFGLFPQLIIDNVVQPAAEALLNNAPYVSKIMGGI
jgi:multicomponent Na+:H+ antiporter subunit D